MSGKEKDHDQNLVLHHPLNNVKKTIDNWNQILFYCSSTRHAQLFQFVPLPNTCTDRIPFIFSGNKHNFQVLIYIFP